MEATYDMAGIFASAADSVVSEATGVVTQVLPIGLGLIAIVLAVSFGLKFIRKVTKG